MEIKKNGTINLLAIFIVVVFTVLSCFTCFEIHFTPVRPIDGLHEIITTIDTMTNNIIPIVVLGVSQIVFLVLKSRFAIIASVICAGLAVCVTVREALRGYVEAAFDSMGGLGDSDFKITAIGYIVFSLGILNFIFQIISSKKKEGKKQ